MILPVLLLECRTMSWSELTRKNSSLYSDIEKIMIEETTTAVDFKYGYDPDLDLDYVFKAGTFTDKDIAAKSPEMKKVLLKYKPKEIISFYEKTFLLKESQLLKMNRFRDRKKWVNTTYIQKYTLPEAEQFLDILEKNVIQIDSAYSAKIEKRKTDLKKIAVFKLQKELKDQERKRREEYKPGWK
jgi:hypothetical protein